MNSLSEEEKTALISFGTELGLKQASIDTLIQNNFTFNRFDEYQHDFRLNTLSGVDKEDALKIFNAIMYIACHHGIAYSSNSNHSIRILSGFTKQQMDIYCRRYPTWPLANNEVTQFFDKICQMYTDCALLQHKFGVTTLEELHLRSGALRAAQLRGVKPAVQKMLAAIIVYVEITPGVTWKNFTYDGYIRFCYPGAKVFTLRG